VKILPKFNLRARYTAKVARVESANSNKAKCLELRRLLIYAFVHVRCTWLHSI